MAGPRSRRQGSSQASAKVLNSSALCLAQPYRESPYRQDPALQPVLQLRLEL